MKCPICNGKGKTTEYDGLRKFWCDYKCEMCNGTGEVQTNEEWFCSLSTEEKAKVLRRRTYGNSEDNETVEQGWVSWLKAKHEDNPPDIPSVPSWDKWLEGERTKCEYCDGTNAECNLVGRFECPETPKTEQEWLHTLNTEQLAEWIAHQTMIALFENQNNHSLRMTYPAYWVEWLKQPHKPIS